jgi:carboxypeptidase family protein/TonB-dependent receptor-like protein
MYRLLICFLACLILSFTSAAQLPSSTLNGTVTDPQGAVVAGAKVVVTSNATGVSRETATGGDGGFTVTDLTPGEYTVRVSASGFATSEFKAVSLDVGRAATLDVSLKIAKTGEVVEVTGAELAVNTTQSEVQGLVESQTIESLPLNGRNYLELAFLIPGNRPAPRFDPTKTNTLEVSSAGAYGRGGNIIIDGADNNDEVVGGTLMNFPEDGVAEFQIATKFTAEVGRSSSSIINVATKSGTNDVHGSEYIFFRHKDLQGLPATFDRRLPTPRFSREQFGGSLGGPVVRDKLFGFLAMEYLTQDHAVPVGVRDFTTNTVTGGSAPAFVHDFRLTSKGDWILDDKDHISLRYSFERSLDVDNGFLTQPLGAAANRQQSLNRYNSFLASWSRTFSSTQVNTLIYQKNYFINKIPAFSPNDPVTNPAGLAAGNEIRFPSVQDGANYRIPQRTRLARDQLRDTFYWSLGRHNMSFGGEYQYYGSDILFDLFGSGSIFTTGDFPTQNLFTGTPCSAATPCNDTDIPIAIALKSGAPVRPPTAPYEHNHYLGLFVQDDWHIKPSLTLNLGLRWDGDFNSLGETEQNKPCPSLTTPSPNCEFIRNLLGPHDSSAKYKNFGPRVGFAWDHPLGVKNTVVRGGYGIYYDRVILEPALLEELLNGRALPIVAFASSTCNVPNPALLPINPSTGKPIPNNSLAVCGLAPNPATYGAPRFDANTATLANPFVGASPFGIGVTVLDNKAATPYVQQFTLGVQHQFGKDYIVSVDGLHNRGTRQLIPRFLRSLPPGVTTPFINCPNGRDPCTVIDPATGKTAAAGCPADPSCQSITDIESSARSWYDAMLVTFQKRPGSGPWHPGYQISYTLSKTFDEQQDDQVSPSGKPTEDPAVDGMHVNNLRIEKGYAVTDERHHFVFFGSMEVPWKINLSPIWTWSSSIPEDSFVGALSGRLPNIPRNALGRQIQDGTALNAAIIAYNALPACLPNGNTAGPLPCNEGQLLNAAGTGPLQVNPKIKFGNSFNSFDMRLSRTFHFKEPHALQAIAEAFNLFNVTNIRGTTNRNYSGVNNTIDSPTFNQALDTAGKFFGSGGPRAFQFALRYTF